MVRMLQQPIKHWEPPLKSCAACHHFVDCDFQETHCRGYWRQAIQMVNKIDLLDLFPKYEHLFPDLPIDIHEKVNRYT